MPPDFATIAYLPEFDRLPSPNREHLQAQVIAEADFLSRVDWQSSLGWQPSDRQMHRFLDLYQIVLVGNCSQNLTRITEPDAFWEKHLWDSLRGLACLGSLDELAQTEKHAIDIGTGAGFPGLPIAIAYPRWNVTLLDSTRKKITFVTAAIQALVLPNARAIAKRSEAIGQQPGDRERYDLATLRAIGPAVVCAEYALPLVKVGGRIVMYRGQWTEAETRELEAAAMLLGGEIAAIDSFATPLSGSVRHGIVLEKRSPTPAAYPRLPGIPNRQPLGTEKPT